MPLFKMMAQNVNLKRNTDFLGILRIFITPLRFFGR